MADWHCVPQRFCGNVTTASLDTQPLALVLNITLTLTCEPGECFASSAAFLYLWILSQWSEWVVLSKNKRLQEEHEQRKSPMGFHLFTPDHVVQSYRGPQGVMRIISWNNANASSWGGFDTGAPENLKKKALPHQAEVVRKVRALARRVKV